MTAKKLTSAEEWVREFRDVNKTRYAHRPSDGVLAEHIERAQKEALQIGIKLGLEAGAKWLESINGQYRVADGSPLFTGALVQDMRAAIDPATVEGEEGS